MEQELRFGLVRQLLRPFFSCFHGQNKILKNNVDGEILSSFKIMEENTVAIRIRISFTIADVSTHDIEGLTTSRKGIG